MGTFLFIELRDLALAHHHPAHTRADDHADPVRVFTFHFEVGIGSASFGRHERKLGIAIHTIALAGRRYCSGEKPTMRPAIRDR